MPFNFSTICRLCMKQERNSQGLFDNGGTLCSKITSLFPELKISSGDGMPAQVCYKCVYQVETFFNFKAQCEATDVALRQHLKSVQLITESIQNMLVKQETSVKEKLSSVDIAHCSHGHAQICKTNAQEIQGICKISADARTASPELKEHSVVKAEKPYRVNEDRLSLNNNNNNNNNCDSQRLLRSQKQRTETRGTGNIKSKQRTELKCYTCHKVFTKPGNLTQHLRIHEDFKPYQCPHCSKCFQRITYLRRHCAVHTGEKPFSCTVCGKSFGRKDKLIQHSRLHTFTTDENNI